MKSLWFGVHTIINAFLAMALSLLITMPLIWLTVFFFFLEIKSTNDAIYAKSDIIFVIFSIGLLFEIGDRLYRGIKSGNLVSIIRVKQDRW